MAKRRKESSLMQTPYTKPLSGSEKVADFNLQLWRNARESFGIDYSENYIDWIQKRFYIPELMGPIKLAPYQIGALHEAYKKNERGEYKYRLVVWSDLKKSAKSTIASAVVLERARRTRFGSFKVVANTLKQADSRVSFYFRRAIELARVLNDPFQGVTQRSLTTSFDNYSKVESVPLNPGGEAGGNDDMIVFSELWAANSNNHERMWTEMTLSPLKDGQRWVETYAGIKGKSPILEPIHDRLVKSENRIDISYIDENGDYVDLSHIEAYADGYTFCLWNTQRGLHWWQTDEYYESEAETLLPEEFNRVHGNEFSSSTSKFVPDEWWAGCLEDEEDWPTIRKREAVIITLDAAVTNDSFGMLAGVRRGGETYVIYTNEWTAEKDGVIDYTGTRDEPGPELELRRLLRKYRVTEVRYDRYMLHDMMTRLKKKPIFKNVRFFDFPQQGLRLVADRQFYETVRDNRIHARRTNTQLTTHVQNADRKNLGDNRLRLIKRSPKAKIDLAVCASMLAYVDDKEKEVKEKPKGVTVSKADGVWGNKRSSKRSDTKKGKQKGGKRRRVV